MGSLVCLKITNEGKAACEAKMLRRQGGTVGRIMTPGTNWSPAIGAAKFLIHDGLVYAMGFGGVLRVFDADKLQLVYERQLDFVPITYAYPYPYGAGVCASPTLGGKYIYLWGATGTTIVIEPGRQFKQIAINTIESAIEGDLIKWRDHFRADHYYPECTISSPIFDGGRIYYRAEEFVYCIGGPERAAASAKAKHAVIASRPGQRRVSRSRRTRKPATAEQRANSLLSMARNYLSAEMNTRAEKKCRELIRKYPGTEQAKTAREMLRRL